jgi:hypothetical protein
MQVTEADEAILAAYRAQVADCRAAMDLVLEHGAFQAATLLAVQAVRAAATLLLAAHTGTIATDEVDPVAALWLRVPALRRARALQEGANVIALQDDLALYAYIVDGDEAREVIQAAHTFCAWALERRVAAQSPCAPRLPVGRRIGTHGPNGAMAKHARPVVSSGT